MKKYRKLIDELPIEEHGFRIKRETWKNLENSNTWYKEINDLIFKNNVEIYITRGRLKKLAKSDNIAQFILETIYWGYPKGYTDGRNIYLPDLLENFKKWEELVQILKKDGKIIDFKTFYKENVEPIKGLGLSTFTKIIYFLETKINGNEALIFDSQIVERLSKSQFRNSQFETLNPYNTPKNVKNYELYLEYIKSLATEIETTTEKIEMFLFIFGGVIYTEKTE